MPRHKFTCEKCQKTLDKTVKLSERDNQVCEEVIILLTSTSPCGGKLVREEISETAKMGLNWGIR